MKLKAPPVFVEVKKIGDNHHQILYVPYDDSDVEASIMYGGLLVGKKRAIPVIDVTHIKLEGPGVEGGNVVGKETQFTVDASETGKRDLDVEITGPNGELLNTEEEVGGEVQAQQGRRAQCQGAIQ